MPRNIAAPLRELAHGQIVDRWKPFLLSPLEADRITLQHAFAQYFEHYSHSEG